MNDVTFDRDLSVVADRAVYPATPHLRARVLATIAAPPPESQSRGRSAPFAFAAAAVGAIVVTAAAVLAVPTSRSAVADFFGIEGSEIDVIPSTTPLAPPENIGASAELSTIDAVSDELGFDLRLPNGDDEPNATYIVRYGTQSVVVLRYSEFDLWQARLEPDASFGKGAPAGVTVTDTFVDAMPARWISGGSHVVQFNNPDGTFVQGSDRTVDTNTLIWNDGETFFRMETALTLEEAQTIAESLR